MIIWGSRGLTSVIDSGQFHCCTCDTTRVYSLKQVRNFFTLYFIPIIPLNVAGRYAECGWCGGTFAEEATTYDPRAEREEINLKLLRVMVMSALADGEVDEGERREIQKQYTEVSGLPVAAATLDQEIGLAITSKSDLNSYVKKIAPELSPHGKGLVVRLAFLTMSASGDLKPGHQAELAKLATSLGVPQDQYMEFISQLSDPETA